MPDSAEQPYIEQTVTTVIRRYNPRYGDDRKCRCGHAYYRHFDTYEGMYPIGCKYCDCDTFVEATPTTMPANQNAIGALE